jgi:ComF family protein
VLRSATLFGGNIREALHRLKYNQDIGIGEALAPHLVDVFYKQDWNIDLVTCVPLSPKRQRIRGYNQAEMLSMPFAALINKPHTPRAIHRIVDTRSQIDLNADERRKNVSGAFYANAMYVDQKSVIIIDDVSTTGSTISECAQALKQAGAKKVYALTLARAPLKLQ